MSEQPITCTNERLWDLLRFCRSELHVNELISDEEFSALVQRQGAVDRLESYDSLRAELDSVKAKLALARKDIRVTEEIAIKLEAERDTALADANYWKKQYEIRDGALNLVVASESRLQTELAAANKRADDAVAAERERCATIALEHAAHNEAMGEKPWTTAALACRTVAHDIRKPKEGGDAIS